MEESKIFNQKGEKMKTAIVTGASGGIGKATVVELVKNGYFVSAWYNSNQAGVDELMGELSSMGYSGCAFAVQADLSNDKGVYEAFSKTAKSFNHIDLLVNNAGVSLYKLATETEDVEWDKVFSVNVKSAFILSKLVLPKMIEKKLGRIINVSSVWGISGACMESAYSASKAAVIGFTKALSKEVAPSGITVNCVCPGVIDTKMNARFSKSELEEIKNQIPVNRLGNPSEIASLIAFLASENAGYITGQTITCDGGYIL